MKRLSELQIWNTPYPRQLLKVIGLLESGTELPNFLRDVLTEKEIVEISARFEAARLLRAGESYETIQAQTKLSTRTIARISLWLKQGTGGYAAALTALHHSHTSPARAD